MGQQDILFPRKSSGQISRTKVSTWSGKENLAKRSKLGKGGGIPAGSFQVPGVGRDLELSLPLLRSVWQDRSISTPRARRSNSDSPLHFPSVQKQGEWALALVCGTHPPRHPTHQIWSERKKAVPRRAFQPRNVARTARRGTGSRPVLPWQLPPCAG